MSAATRRSLQALKEQLLAESHWSPTRCSHPNPAFRHHWKNGRRQQRSPLLDGHPPEGEVKTALTRSRTSTDLGMGFAARWTELRAIDSSVPAAGRKSPADYETGHVASAPCGTYQFTCISVQSWQISLRFAFAPSDGGALSSPEHLARLET